MNVIAHIFSRQVLPGDPDVNIRHAVWILTPNFLVCKLLLMEETRENLVYGIAHTDKDNADSALIVPGFEY